MLNQYKVAIYYTPMSFPLNFTCHTWVEISHNEQTDRYDLWAYHGVQHGDMSKNYIYRNIFPQHLGTTFSPLANPRSRTGRQVGKIFQSISGDETSVAAELYLAISKNAFDYPFDKKYNLVFGPTCNTFTQWVINLVPDAKLRLPWNAWGKGSRVSSGQEKTPSN